MAPQPKDLKQEYQEIAAIIGKIIDNIENTISQDLPANTDSTRSPRFFDPAHVDVDIFNTIEKQLKSMQSEKDSAGIKKPIIEYLQSSLTYLLDLLKKALKFVENLIKNPDIQKIGHDIGKIVTEVDEFIRSILPQEPLSQPKH